MSQQFQSYRVVDKTFQPKAWVIIGPADMVLTLQTLPYPEPHNLCCKEKAELVLAYRAGLLCERDIERVYGISPKQLKIMDKALRKGGLKALKKVDIPIESGNA